MGRALAEAARIDGWMMQRKQIKEQPKEREGQLATDRYERFRRVFEPSCLGAVLFSVLIVGIYIAVRVTAPSFKPHAQLRFVENDRADSASEDPGIEAAYREPLAGSAYDEALRLREAGSLGLAISLSVFAKQASTGTVPANSAAVIRDLEVRKLLPPGIAIDNDGFRSSLSDLRFSYRGDPFSFEILALPKEGGSGSAILLRFPLPPTEANSIMYFEAASDLIPTPFSATEQITAAGWRIRHWRGNTLPLNETVIRELREYDEWLKAQDQGR